MKEIYRGVTEWKGDGAYTHEETNILVTAISKYEINLVRRTVQKIGKLTQMHLSSTIKYSISTEII